MPDVLRVALEVPLRQLFDYLAPPSGLVDVEPSRAAIGRRVRVPFGRRRLVGVVIETAAESDVPSGKLKSALEWLDAPLVTRPVLDERILELLKWAADYYHHPVGEAIAAALPRALRLGGPAEPRERIWTATPEGLEAFGQGEPARARTQRRLLGLLVEARRAAEGALEVAMPNWREAARALARRGWAVSSLEAAAEAAARGSPGVPEATQPAPSLTADQAAAVGRICGSAGRFAAWVLHGITGSGKTEVYLRVVEEVLRRGERALVLVPEIGLTPQLVKRFRARFATPLAVMHSALTDRERLEAWREAASGRASIVIGTRSAVFAPVPSLGVIVVDEEHDSSFKQHDGGFRYSARDVAVVRAQRAAVPVILGSATPALETLHNIETQRYERLSLPHRAVQAQPPRLALIDLRAHPAHAGLSMPALQAIERHLNEQGQVLVFLNRRGYAPTLLCTGCGWIAPCRNCDARMTVHRAAQRLKCHHCGAEAPLPEHCPQCGYPVKSVGQGTERVQETLASTFHGTTLVRLDRDVVRHQCDLASAMARVASGVACILVGTQMVTKGHDFPNMTLVVVLNADQGLFSTDFRAPERLAQTIVQVAGRAGRGIRPGEVLIQTEYPDHPLLRNLLAEGYEGFARTALAERAQAAWPPFSRLAAVRDSSTTPGAALEFLTQARRAAGKPARVRLLGPVPAAMAKRAGRYHAQLLIESPDRTALHEFLASWLPEMAELPSARHVRWALDVDPIELF
ncbi:MAG TPA: primosomal protein N' [Steroidobacteraceae bacterium]|nr:primosomal protein N' [Steroidobacteraceae bacterium]